MTDLERIDAAAKSGRLLATAAENIASFLSADLPAWAVASIHALVEQEAWPELNDRFYRFLEFGTGGMRGRTIGAVQTGAEAGSPTPEQRALGTPEHAAIGSNMMNDFTVARAVVGLFRYTRKYLAARGSRSKPRIVIAYDVRHFSDHFCRLSASTWVRLGGEAYIFDGPRPTPQLSYSVRWLRAHAGVVITASHNPPHDNGFKAYFGDGAQVVPPHDTGIVSEVNAVPLGELGAFLAIDVKAVTMLGHKADEAYLGVASRAALDPAVFRRAQLRVAFTNIHGTGGVHAPPLLVHAGCDVRQVREQVAFDPRFPTVKSPNPENSEALSKAVALAEREGCDVVLATDPDCDRMGCAVRNREGRMELLTGNQTGALLAQYRLMRMEESGLIPAGGSARACIIKTFVTSGLAGRHRPGARLQGHQHADRIQVDRLQAARVRGGARQDDGAGVQVRCDDARGARAAAPPARDVPCFRVGGELRIPAQRHGARQGRQCRLPHVRRTLRLGQKPGSDGAGASRPPLRNARLLPRGDHQPLLRRGERQREDQPHHRQLPVEQAVRIRRGRRRGLPGLRPRAHRSTPMARRFRPRTCTW